jgi:CHAT domain-containing protein
LGNPDLGDPKHDLPAAEAAVGEIARHFGSGHAAIATRKDATRAFLAANADTATHLHLACHARGGAFNPEKAGIALAGDWLPATELVRRSLRARVTVVSACQTAVIADIARFPDEAFSLSTAFLAAGSASAVATLWSVDDAATALLMTRLYEELLNGKQPAQALRRGQLWLRDLTETEETTFLAARPALEKEFQRRAEHGRRPGLRSTSNMNTPELERRPYSAPEFWAAFVLAGQ